MQCAVKTTHRYGVFCIFGIQNLFSFFEHYIKIAVKKQIRQ